MIISFNFLFELGFGPTFIRAISYGLGGASSMNDRSGDGNLNENFLKLVWQNTKVVYTFLTGCFLLILVIAGYFIVKKPISHLTVPSEGWTAWYITIFGAVISFFGNIYTVFLQGVNKIAQFRRIETLFSIFSILSCAIGIQFGLKFLGLVCLSQFWVVIGALRNYLLCKKNEIYLKINSTFTFKVDKQILVDLWHSSWRSAIGMFMSYGIINSSSLYFAQFDNVKEVSSYLFAMRILQILINISMAPFYTKIPQLAKLYAMNEKNEILRISKKGMLLSHSTFVVMTIFIGVSAPYLLTLIHSSIGFVDAKLWSLMMLAFFIERYGAMHMQLYSITNIILWHIANSITGVILLVSLLLTIPQLSFYAYPLSMIISYLGFYSWFAAKKSLRLLNISFIKFELTTSVFPFSILLFYIIYHYFM